MLGSVPVCARPLPNPHWHTSTFEFSGSGYHKRGGNTGSTFSRGANSDLVTEATVVRHDARLAVFRAGC